MALQAGGESDRAGEPAAGGLGGCGQEGVQPARQRGERGVQLLAAAGQAADLMYAPRIIRLCEHLPEVLGGELLQDRWMHDLVGVDPRSGTARMTG